MSSISSTAPSSSIPRTGQRRKRRLSPVDMFSFGFIAIFSSVPFGLAQVIQPTTPIPQPNPSATIPQLPAGTIAISTPTATPYTAFDLFKNSGFVPCALNASPRADNTTTDFIVTRRVATQSEFCSFLAGVPIMIPTAPTQTAFFPWYPTQIVQAASLTLSYIGLYFSLRHIDRGRMRVPPPKRLLPGWAWAQLVFDLARIIAWLFKTIHAFFDPSRFAWTSMVLWLLPLNYALGMRILRREKAARVDEPYVGAAQQLQQLRELDFGVSPPPKITLMSGTDRSVFSPLTTFTSPRSARGSEGASTTLARYTPALGPGPGPGPADRAAGASASVYAWIATTAIMAFLSFVGVILHWKWAFGRRAGPFTQTYTQTESSLRDPRALGALPETCIDYLRTGALARSDFLRLNQDQLTFALLQTLQFVGSLGVLVLLALAPQERYDRAYRTLWMSLGATMVLLLVPALALGVDLAIKVGGKKERVSMRFTNDLARTGGCTFAFVNMERSRGYWDVELERGFRIAMAFLGGA